jgi:pimeloyl-ACP methyl ester carboxylesterase
MFRNLIPLLAGRFHVLAPDYPGFGYSETPPPNLYRYTFAHIAQTIDGFLSEVSASSYVLYMQDYGGPIGFRIATAHPDRIKGIVIQNTTIYEDGINKEWRDQLDYEVKHGPPQSTNSSPSAASKIPSIADIVRGIEPMYLGGARDPSAVSPDSYTLDAAIASDPKKFDAQDVLGDDYYTNVILYPTWQKWLRMHQPKTLIVWGEGDQIFTPQTAKDLKRDVPQAKLVFYPGSHFMLEEYAPEVAREIIQTFASH